MKTMTVEQVTDMIICACDAIIENKPYLTDIDSAIGDGDHGIGMAGGMAKAKEALLAERPFPDVNAVFKTTGMSMLNSMGGASGVIFGTMFLGGVKGMGALGALDALSLAKLMRGSLEAVKERGKAQPGDKTMVDALEPAVLAMENSTGDDLPAALAAAKDAAHKGVEDTKQYVAKYGRAKSLLERAIGHQDAGATSVAIIFEAMHSYAANAAEADA